VTGPTTHTPPGTVSTIRGRWQAPALTWLTRLILVAAASGAVLPSRVGTAFATAAVAAVVAAPLVRVAWLIHRWRQEHDRRFVLVGLALLAVVGIGAALAAVGVGS
jgi:uncharacterized membrane protein YczE